MHCHRSMFLFERDNEFTTIKHNYNYLNEFRLDKFREWFDRAITQCAHFFFKFHFCQINLNFFLSHRLQSGLRCYQIQNYET